MAFWMVIATGGKAVNHIEVTFPLGTCWSNWCSRKTVFFKYIELLSLQTIFGIEEKLSNFDLILVYEHKTVSYAKNSAFD